METASTPIYLRWILVIVWTLTLGYLMLAPGDGTIAHNISNSFGGTELSDAAGHLALAFVETLLLYHLLSAYFPPRSALIRAVGIALFLGMAFEAAQHFIPSRGTSLLDLSANTLGAALAAGVVTVLGSYIRQSASGVKRK